MQQILAYIASIFIGISLGLIGGGGSILTVPVLVYLLGLSPVIASGYSLFVVGTTSLFGAGNYMRRQLVDYRAAVIFAIPSFITVYLTRKFIVPAIPDVIFTIANFQLTKAIAIMVLFAVVMFFAALTMIRKRKILESEEPVKHKTVKIALQGVMVGILSGMVGAGGGFLIIPALVLLAKLPMKRAVGTSLLIIAVNSLIGFLGDVTTYAIDWRFLLGFTALPVVGIFIGSWLAKFIPGEKLKKGFGWFVLVMAVYILAKELLN
ncbi:MAG: sulfite exporter TauE/SafE family protein [Bacteroidia bacterium]